MTLSIDELLAYSDGERRKWRDWLAAQPAALFDAPVQPGARFATVWDLLDHIAIVEARHLERLRRGHIPAATSIARGDAPGLFAFWDRARQGLRVFIATTNGAAIARDFVMADGQTYTLTPRKLIFHILLHETRHLAQIADAVRNAGYPPPGRHDLFYSDALD